MPNVKGDVPANWQGHHLFGSLGIGGEVGINHGKSQRATFFDILIVLVA